MKKKYLNKRNIIMIIMTFVFVMSVNLIFSNIEAIGNIEPEQTALITSEEKNTQNQEGIFDTKSQNEIYRTSEDSFNYLPFVRYVTDRIIVDEKISGIGALFSLSNIEVNSPMTGLQVLFSNDTVRVNSNIEYGIIFVASNAVIDGTVDKPLIVFAGDSITISESAVLNSDIICYSNSLNIAGKIKGSVLGASNNIKIEGYIEKDLRVQGTNIDIKDEKNILGNVYVETYNNSLNIKEKYPNAIIKILEVQNNKLSYDVVINSIITCLLFTLIYILLNKKTNGKIYEQASTIVKENKLFVILSGSISILAMPAIILILVMLSAFGLHSIAIPAILVYVVGVIVISLLSTLIVGSLFANYMSKNYFKDKSTALKTIGTFFVFLSLNILSKLQYIGMYVTMTLILLSVGIVMAYMFKKNNKIVNKVEK